MIKRLTLFIFDIFSGFLLLSSCGLNRGKDISFQAIQNRSPSIAELDNSILSPKDLIEVSTGPELDYQSAFFIRKEDGAWQIVFERWKAPEFAGRLMITTSLDHQRFESPVPLKLLDKPLQLSPASLLLNDDSYLYFMAGDAVRKSTHFYRSLYREGFFGLVEKIKLDDELDGILAWPHPIALSKNLIILAYDNYRTSNNVAFSDDGLVFRKKIKVGTGQMGRVAAYKGGQLVYTWQTGYGTNMTVWHCLSRDGITWSKPAPITNGSTDVHDAMPFSRLDGGVDVYYIYTGTSGYSIYRRSVSLDGRLGREERITSDSVGSVTQPHPHRLKDGRIVLTFTREITSQIDYDVLCAMMENDAGI